MYRTSRYQRMGARSLALLMLWVTWQPTVVWALTNGPTQPEFTSFEPIGTDQMVDLFTGDFTYNIPLLTVPGPNGGYPINLAYHSGITMEQEATWVGLGWNINVGSVTRQLRGLPDDFNGDKVKKTVNLRDQETVGVTLAPSQFELVGGEMTYLASVEFYNDTYKGFGYRFGLNPYKSNSEPLSTGSWEFSRGPSVNFDSNSGLGFGYSLSLSNRGKHLDHSLTAGLGLHSRQGVSKFALGYTQSIHTRERTRSGAKGEVVEMGENDCRSVSGGSLFGSSSSTGIDFAQASYIPGQFAPTTSLAFGFRLDWGSSTPASWTQQFSIGGAYSSTRISNRTRSVPAYGYQYSQSRELVANGLMDFNRDKDVPVTSRSEVAPMPIFTYDSYLVSGQGTGGSFRPHRSDIGLLRDEEILGTSDGGDAVLELGFGSNSAHIGFDGGYIDMSSYSGGWRGGLANLTNSSGLDLTFKDRNGLFEPSYFRSAGERTAEKLDEWSGIHGEDAVRFKLGNQQGAVGFVRPVPKAQPFLGTGASYAPVPASAAARDEREKRVQSIEYRTMSEINDRPDFNDRPCYIFTANQLPGGQTCGSGAEKITYDDSDTRGSHIGEVSVVEPNGMRYIYGFPVYNNVHKEVAFSVPPPPAGLDPDSYNPPRIPGDDPDWEYGPVASLPTNEYGLDNFYSSTELPPYVHSYLLTEIVSPDYVDLLDDGPTEDDLGYYVKFNYTRAGTTDPYKWRIPYRGANYVKGHYSDGGDDRGTYTYGEREVYYLHSVETKTHVALFQLGNTRPDSRGAYDEDNDPATLGATEPQLDRIILYSKSDPTKPLKTVGFKYDNSLCPGVENASGGAGKLTLRAVWFQYLDNPKGQLSPYQFKYAFGAGNPGYSYMALDRWGNYKPEAPPYLNHEYPYVDQNTDYDAYRHTYAAAWCLESIKLPSGGTISVKYESDDYECVQDRKAMQMFRILGTSTDQCATINQDPWQGTVCATDMGRIKKNDLRVYFQLEEQFDDYAIRNGLNPNSTADQDAYIEEHIRDIEDLYFKTWQRLMPGSGGTWDYVEGYCKIDHDDSSYGVDNGITASSDPNYHRVGYITLIPATYKLGVFDIHPFRKAGWQSIRFERDDLFQSSQNFDPFFLLTFLTSAAQLLFGYYNVANLYGYCQRIAVNQDEKPSYIRLNSPDGIKYGGGHRVASVTLTDSWAEGSAQYGKTYEYRTTDANGRTVSSGVATYEPLVGGQEIPQHQPVWYNGNDALISFRHDDAYVEEPFGEALFPAPSVGYSKVTVRDLPDPDGLVNTNLSGITVHEFYTAKDFPVRVDHTTLEAMPPNIPVPVFIPLVGSFSFNSRGYSQGYSVELNDMHGKPRSVATYAACAGTAGQPTTRTTYEYSTYPGQNRLNNHVKVLYDHWIALDALLGQTQEFYADVRENSSVTNVYKAELNLDVVYLAFFPSLWPGWDHQEAMFRSIVTTKVIHKLGIPIRTIHEEDGAKVITENLLFDAYTGEPLYTTVNNMFDDPVYNYTYAAHFAYPGMEGAYQNWGALYQASITSGDVTVSGLSDHRDVFHAGDELEVNDGSTVKVYWVMSVGQSSAQIARADATTNISPGNVTVKIRRSGHRNMQAVKNGTIVSLKDVLTSVLPPILQAFNAQVSGDPGYSSNGTPPNVQQTNTIQGYVDCAIQAPLYNDEVTVHLQPPNVDGPWPYQGFWLEFYYTVLGEGSCRTFLFLPPSFNGNIDELTIVGFTGSQVSWGSPPLTNTFPEILVQDANGATYAGVWKNLDCFSDCMRVLHADATEYADEWSYDYVDAGSPNTDVGSGSVALANNPSSFNPYKYAQQGVWRPYRNHLFQVDRINKVADSETDIRVDGEYDKFRVFDFDDPSNTFDDRWVPREKMTRYDACGFAVESEDALGVPSAEFYGYGNSVVTAAAKNAGYYEIGYDGFEDHASSTAWHGHLQFTNGSAATVPLVTDVAHTGEHSAKLTGSDVLRIPSIETSGTHDGQWVPNGGEQVVSAWFHVPDASLDPVITVTWSGGSVSSSLSNDKSAVDGWRKADLTFHAPTTGYLTIEFSVPGIGTSDDWYVDDVRVHPSDASIGTFVYDPAHYWLVAQLDDQNYATFYNYDEEGTLVQVKKETERGIVTLRTTRKHFAQPSPPPLGTFPLLDDL